MLPQRFRLFRDNGEFDERGKKVFLFEQAREDPVVLGLYVDHGGRDGNTSNGNAILNDLALDEGDLIVHVSFLLLWIMGFIIALV
jgi:hypothetical protein